MFRTKQHLWVVINLVSTSGHMHMHRIPCDTKACIPDEVKVGMKHGRSYGGSLGLQLHTCLEVGERPLLCEVCEAGHCTNPRFSGQEL